METVGRVPGVPALGDVMTWDGNRWINQVPAGGVPSGAASGDLGSTYPNPTVARVNGTALGTTSATAGTALIGTGSAIASVSLSGDATINGSGVVALKSTGTAGTYASVTTDAQGRVTAGANLSGDITTSGSAVTTLKNTGPGALSVTNANITIDAQGRVTAASSGTGAATTVPLLSSDCSVHSITGTLTETVLKTFSFVAANTPVAANSLVVVTTLWSFVGVANVKAIRIYIGAAGSGTGGTQIFNVNVSSGSTTAARDVYIYFRATNSELVYCNLSTTHEGTNNSGPTTASVDVTANWEITITAALGTSTDTAKLEAATVELRK